MKLHNIGMLLLVLSSVGFGLMPVFAAYAYAGGINVHTLLFIRFSIVAFILFTYVFIKDGKPKVGKYDLLSFFILGGICYSLQSSFYFSSFNYIPKSLAALLLFTYPIIVSVASLFIDKEKLTFKTFVSLFLSFIGLALLLSASLGTLNLNGILLALSASAVYSFYVIYSNHVVRHVSPVVTIAFVSLFSAFTLLVSGFVSGELILKFDLIVWAPISGLVFLSTVLATLTFFYGLKILGATKSSILSMLEPLFVALFSFIIFNETITYKQIIGGVILLSGAALIAASKNDKSLKGGEK